MTAELDLIEALEDLSSLIELREGWVTINGVHVDIGAGGIVMQGPKGWVGKPAPGGKKSAPTATLSKSELAKQSYSGGDHHQQMIAEKMENHLAKELGMKKSPDNKPFDLFGTKYAVEVKTMVSNTNDKITMNKAAVGRKDAFIKQSKLTPYTVVVDARGKTPTYHVRAGYGSFRLGSMTQVASPAGIRTFMRAQ
ncbi:MAG TPA: hypothetical protein VFC21_06890 [Bryobacteraceae bacterium]|nr:hypothetical protein [Bryobacteraceae bacterium]